MNELLTPAAQYLRMSTEHQEYSIDHQADVIAAYAAANGFQIVRSYTDYGRSGLTIKKRTGLKTLLADVVSTDTPFKAVLVYDVSRWGRFQDLDEAAHYEFLCKSSGAPIHYCAESFVNNKSMPDLIMKALKRTMAGEYSRELSAKTTAGLRRLTALGYKGGGQAIYGLRRQLLSSDGTPKQILKEGEWKSLLTERVVHVRGPEEECQVVQRIFREFADDGLTLRRIAAGLNSGNIPYVSDRKWEWRAIRRTLQNTTYMGLRVWGKSTEALATPRRPTPPEGWVISPTSFEPIISRELFQRAEARFASFTYNQTDEQLLEKLRRLYQRHRTLTGKIIDKSSECPALSTYQRRFGSIRKVYAQLGLYSPEKAEAALSARQRLLLCRQGLEQQILKTFPDRLAPVRRNRRFKVRFRVRGSGRILSLQVGNFFPTRAGKERWRVEIPTSERRGPGVVALLKEDRQSIRSLWVLPDLKHRTKVLLLREDSEWLARGESLSGLDDLLDVLELVLNGPC